jgi:hypothetical protein
MAIPPVSLASTAKLSQVVLSASRPHGLLRGPFRALFGACPTNGVQTTTSRIEELDIVIRHKGLYAGADDIHSAITALERKRTARPCRVRRRSTSSKYASTPSRDSGAVVISVRTESFAELVGLAAPNLAELEVANQASEREPPCQTIYRLARVCGHWSVRLALTSSTVQRPSWPKVRIACSSSGFAGFRNRL